jgi:hypothetical protein
VLSCVGRGLGAGLIPRPRSPTKYRKGFISKKENPTPEKCIRKKRERRRRKMAICILLCHHRLSIIRPLGLSLFRIYFF